MGNWVLQTISYANFASDLMNSPDFGGEQKSRTIRRYATSRSLPTNPPLSPTCPLARMENTLPLVMDLQILSGQCWLWRATKCIKEGLKLWRSLARTIFCFHPSQTSAEKNNYLNFTYPFLLNGAWPPVQEGFARSKTGLYWMQNDQLLVLTPNQGGLHDVEVWDLPQRNKFCMFRGHKIKFGWIKHCKFG